MRGIDPAHCGQEPAAGRPVRLETWRRRGVQKRWGSRALHAAEESDYDGFHILKLKPVVILKGQSSQARVVNEVYDVGALAQRRTTAEVAMKAAGRNAEAAAANAFAHVRDFLESQISQS